MLILSGCTQCETVALEPNLVETTEAEVTTIPTAEKSVWTEDEIKWFFLSNSREHYEIIDCISMPDFAFDRVGAILFRDDDQQAIWVAFLNEEGFSQMCGVLAPLYSNPEFTYLGDGVVTFRLQAPNGEPYICKVSFSAEGKCVNFKVEADGSMESEENGR